SSFSANLNYVQTLQRAVSRHENALQVIGINLDKDLTTLRQTSQRLGLTWPQVLIPPEAAKRHLWEEASEVGTLPRLFVIDRQGILRADCNPADLDKELTRVLQSP